MGGKRFDFFEFEFEFRETRKSQIIQLGSVLVGGGKDGSGDFEKKIGFFRQKRKKINPTDP